MSLQLDKIELSNIRYHRSVAFEPAKTGVTVISGANGTGKSTLVDSTAWTLYGTKPHGVSKVISLMREGTDLTKEKCFARIDFTLDNTPLRVERRIVSKTGTVECDVWEKTGNDYTHVAGPAVSHSEPYLRKRLKMDEKGFLAAVLVQQKQVDQLISASPPIRAEVIERLTGISSITKALSEARQNYKGLKKVSSLSTIDPTEVDSLQKEKDATEKKFSQEDLTLNKLKDKHKEISERLDTTRTKLNLVEHETEEREQIKEKLSEANTRLSLLEESLKETIEKKDAKKKQINSFAISGNYDELSQQLQDQKRLHLDNTNRLAVNKSTIKELTENEEQLKTVLKESAFFKDGVKSLASVKTLLNQVNDDLKEVKEEIVSLDESIAVQRSGIKRIESAMTVITNESGSCPTCLQEVHDVDKALASLTAEKEQIAGSLAISLETLEQRTIDFKELEERHSQVTEFQEQLIALKDTETRIKELTNKTPELNDNVIESQQNVELLEKQFDELKAVHDVREEYDALLAEAVTLNDRINNITGIKNKLESRLKDLTNVGDILKLRSKVSDLEESRKEVFEKLAEKREEVSLLKVSLDHLSENLVRVQDEAAKYKDLLESVEIAGNSVEVIEEFRQNRIKNAVPMVGNYASELMNRFTDGKFTQLRLDEKFNATVTLANGVDRNVGLLSGGELSAAAISLRLAISMLLNSGPSKNVLILDEVLVSQDIVRAEQILNTIKEVCQGQVVMISHGVLTNEIADKVIEL